MFGLLALAGASSQLIKTTVMMIVGKVLLESYLITRCRKMPFQSALVGSLIATALMVLSHRFIVVLDFSFMSFMPVVGFFAKRSYSEFILPQLVMFSVVNIAAGFGVRHFLLKKLSPTDVVKCFGGSVVMLMVAFYFYSKSVIGDTIPS